MGVAEVGERPGEIEPVAHLPVEIDRAQEADGRFGVVAEPLPDEPQGVPGARLAGRVADRPAQFDRLLAVRAGLPEVAEVRVVQAELFSALARTLHVRIVPPGLGQLQRLEGHREPLAVLPLELEGLPHDDVGPRQPQPVPEPPEHVLRLRQPRVRLPVVPEHHVEGAESAQRARLAAQVALPPGRLERGGARVRRRHTA